MKKITLSFFLFLVIAASAQLPVSTIAGKKQVLVEEFTGHQCQYCSDGHKRLDNLIAQYPGKIFGVNIHAGTFSATGGSYTKDFTTTDGNGIYSTPGFVGSGSGSPCGMVSRTTCTSCTNTCQQNAPTGIAVGRGCFSPLASTVLSQNSYVNIAGEANLNPTTRVLTVNLEIYYTGNGASTNKYTVMLTQDKIMGPQSGASTWYPAMMVGSNYTHTKVLRDVLTTNITGDAITGPVTAGSKFTKTITYTVPTSVKNISVVLNDLKLVGFVSTTDTDILAVASFPITQGTTGVQEVSPLIADLNVYPNPSAGQANVNFNIAESANVSVVVSNMVGQKVFSEDLGNLTPGTHNYTLNASNLQNGLYLISITDGMNTLTNTISIDK